MDHEDRCAGQAVDGVGVRLEARYDSGYRIEAIKAAQAAHPQKSLTIPLQGKDIIAAESVGIGRVVAIMSELLRARIESIQPAAIRTDPNDALLIHQDREDKV